MKRFLAFLAGVAILLSLKTEAHADSLIDRFHVGQVFESHIMLNRKVVPLPSGTWVVSGLFESLNNNNDTTGIVYLTQKEGRFARTIYIGTNESVARRGWALFNDCNRSDLHLRETAENSHGRDQKCWWVNHYTTALTPSSSNAQRQHHDYLSKNGIQIPPIVLGVGYRLADPADFLNVTYFFDPSQDGFPPASPTAWQDSEWHVSRVGQDQKKMAYIEALKGFAGAQLGAVVQGFSGRRQESARPVLPSAR